jgi:site-specific DNA-cytosine methylase
VKYATVCSGIEAPSVAWHPLGWRAAWYSEVAPFPSAVLAARWPGVPNLGDMTQLSERLIEYRRKPAADEPRYVALGNSMAVPVVRWLGERIERVERSLRGAA